MGCQTGSWKLLRELGYVTNWTVTEEKNGVVQVTGTKLFQYLYGKRLGIDLSCLLHLLINSPQRRRDHILGHHDEVVHNVILILSRLEAMNIKCVCVFDGPYTEAKRETKEKRGNDEASTKSLREKFLDPAEQETVEWSDKELRKLVNVHDGELRFKLIQKMRAEGYWFCVSPAEADWQLASHYREQLIDVVLTNDCDLFYLGCFNIVILRGSVDDLKLGKLDFIDFDYHGGPKVLEVVTDRLNELQAKAATAHGSRGSKGAAKLQDAKLNLGAEFYFLMFHQVKNSRGEQWKNEAYKILALIVQTAGHDYNPAGIHGLGAQKVMENFVRYMFQMKTWCCPPVAEFVKYLKEQFLYAAWKVDEEIKKIERASLPFLHGVVYRITSADASVTDDDTTYNLIDIVCSNLQPLENGATKFGVKDIQELCGKVDNANSLEIFTGIMDPGTKGIHSYEDMMMCLFDGDCREVERRPIPSVLVDGAILTLAELDNKKEKLHADKLKRFLQSRSISTTKQTRSELEQMCRNLITQETYMRSKNEDWRPVIRDPTGKSAITLLYNVGRKRVYSKYTVAKTSAPPNNDSRWITNKEQILDAPSVEKSIITKRYGVEDKKTLVWKKANRLIDSANYLNGFGYLVDGTKLWLRCLVTASMKVEIYSCCMLLTFDTENKSVTKIEGALCECKAAEGGICHHSLFLVRVFYYMRHPPEVEPACTQKLCVWNRSLTSNVTFDPYVKLPLKRQSFVCSDNELRGNKKQRSMRPLHDETSSRADYIPLPTNKHEELKTYGPTNATCKKKVHALMKAFPNSAFTAVWGKMYSFPAT